MDFRSIGLGLTFALIWSSAFTSARILVQAMPPLMLSCIRFFTAGVLAVAIAYMMGQRITFSRKIIRGITVFGLCQNAIYLGLFFVAMQTIEASLAAIIASMMPLIVGAIQSIVFREHLTTSGNIGLFLGFAGACAIMLARASGGVDMMGLLLCFIGVTALAIATLSVRSASSGGNIFMIVGLQMLVAAVALLPFALLTEEWRFEASPLVLSAFAYTVFISSIVGTFVWFLLVNRIGPIKAATFHFANPFFGVAIAAFVLDEKLGLIDVFGVLTITVGILAVQMSKIKVRQAAA